MVLNFKHKLALFRFETTDNMQRSLDGHDLYRLHSNLRSTWYIYQFNLGIN